MTRLTLFRAATVAMGAASLAACGGSTETNNASTDPALDANMGMADDLGMNDANSTDPAMGGAMMDGNMTGGGMAGDTGAGATTGSTGTTGAAGTGATTSSGTGATGTTGGTTSDAGSTTATGGSSGETTPSVRP